MTSRKATRNASRRPTSCSAFRPGLEVLEDRIVPTALLQGINLVVTGQPTAVTAGAGFTVVVTAEDQSGQIEQSFDGNVTIGLANGSSGATLGGSLTVSAVNGIATFVGLTLDQLAAGLALQVTDPGTNPGTSSGINVMAPGLASRLVVSTQPPTSIGAGNGFGLVITAEDGFGTVDTTFNGDVTVALHSTISISGTPATLGGHTTVTAVNGVATFSALTIDQAGTYPLDATSDGLSPATTDAVNVTPATTSRLAVLGPFGHIVAGAPFSMEVDAEDAYGNVEPTFNGSITIALDHNPGSGTLSGGLTAQAVNGVATFSGLSISNPGNGYTIDASSSDLSPASSAPFNVTQGQLVITTEPPTSVGAGQGFSLVVKAEDELGTVLTFFSGSVTVALDNPPGNTGTLDGAQTVTATNGIATFSGLSVDQAGLGYVLHVTASGLTTATSTAFDVIAGAATRLVLITGAQTLTAGQPSGNITAQLEDAEGNVSQAGSGGMTITLSSTSSGGTFFDTNGLPLANPSVTMAAGASRASFRYEDSHTGSPTLTLASVGLPSVTQTETVGAATATAVVFTTAPQVLTAGQASAPISVQLQDQYGNVAQAGSGGLTLTLSTTSAGGTFQPVNLTIAQGASTGTFQYTDTVTGTPTLKVATATFQATQDETVNGATPSAVVFTTAPQVLTAGQVSSAISVQLQDRYGNVTQAGAGGLTLNLSSTSNVGLFLSTSDQVLSGSNLVVAQGASTASFKYADTLSGTPTVKVAGGSFQATQDETVNPATPGIQFTTAPVVLATNQVSALITVQLQDQFGNLIQAGAGGVTLALSTNSTGGTFLSSTSQPLAGPSVTIAQGTSTASFEYKDSRAGTPTVRVQGPGFAATQQETIRVIAPIAFTSRNAATFTAGQANNFTITTSGAPVAAISASGAMPNGINFVPHSDGTATLTGIPARVPGIYRLTFNADNHNSPAVSQSFTLTVNAPPTITSGDTATFSVGQLGSFTITTSAGLPTTTILSKSGALPLGVSFIPSSNGTALLRGTPWAGTGGVYTFTIIASNGTQPNATQTFTLKVNQAPTFSSAASATFVTGQSNSFTVTTRGYPAAAISETGALPNGMTLTDNGNGTATLGGTPAAGTGGTYRFSLSAGNGTLPNATQNFTLTVNQPPVITSAAAATFTTGHLGSFTVTTTPGVPAVTTLSKSGTLPTGVSFIPGPNGTATIKGTAVAGTGGTYTITITASNAPSSKTTQTFTLTVNQAPTITSAASAAFVIGQSGNFTVTTKGYPAAAISETGALPDGVTLTDNGHGTATLGGTPAAGTAGTYHITIGAANGTLPNFSQSFTLTVYQAPVITSAPATSFKVGVKGDFTVTTTPGVPATTTITKSGNLPLGVSFIPSTNGTASLHGVPAAGTGGVYTLTITASNGPLSKTTQTFTLTVNQAPSITSAAGTTFTVGRASSFTVTTKGYPVAAITESGALPDGLTLTDNGNGTATLSGTPKVATGGLYVFTITAKNGTSPDASQTFKLIVNEAPVITSAAQVTFNRGQLNSFTVTTTGFPLALLKLSGVLPAGLTFVNKGDGTAVLSGTPKIAGHFVFKISASDGVFADVSQAFDLTIV
jgi:hypothetical protein